MDGRDRYCDICDQLIDRDDDVFVWRGIAFLDVCTFVECRDKKTNELEGEAE